MKKDEPESRREDMLDTIVRLKALNLDDLVGNFQFKINRLYRQLEAHEQKELWWLFFPRRFHDRT